MLRALAISAPQFQRPVDAGRGLGSSDPASLYNACRVAAQRADEGMGAWAASNWAGGRNIRQQYVRLYTDLLTARQDLGELLETVRPHLLLIGAMTICLPGAVACARMAKQRFGDEICVVLGGRHASETVWKDADGGFDQHVSAPLRLAAEGRIPDIFDAVVAGDGEVLVADLGERVAERVRGGQPAAHARRDLDTLEATPGRWIAGCLGPDGAPRYASGQLPIDYTQLISPAEAFGVTANFDPVRTVRTAHVFSDIGRGCIYDCAFCSERLSVVGTPRDFKSSHQRLARNLKAAEDVIRADTPAAVPTAFVEDSTFLGFKPGLVEGFAQEVETHGLRMRFGAQATFDQVLKCPELLPTLKACGLDFIFIGLETPDPEEIGGMHKDIGHKEGAWLDRDERVFQLLTDNGIEPEVSLLFGLGESDASRAYLFDRLADWRRRYGAPKTVSMNWAVQHPLQNEPGTEVYSYLAWAIQGDTMLDLLGNFGEASTEYPIAGVSPPQAQEVRDVIQEIDAITAPAVASA